MSSENNIGFIRAYKLFENPTGYLSNAFTAQIYIFVALISVGIIQICYNKKDSLINYILSNRLLKHLGKISYGLYLYHWPVLIVLKKIISNKYQLLILALLITYVISYISFNLIEKYFNNYKKRFEYS